MEPIQQQSRNSRMWHKNLYSNFGYQDNYTDKTFLKSLRTNVNQKRLGTYEAVIGAARVTEQVCLVFNFIAIYYVLVDDLYKVETVFIQSSSVTCLAYFYYLKCLQGSYANELGTHFKTVLIFFILGYVLSPVLKTLTQTISTDTINATTFLTMLIHLIFFDYKVPAAIASRALSLNAAIFGSLCLASRVPSSFHAFVLLTVAVECFVLYPTFAYAVRKEITIMYIFSLISLTISLLTLLSTHMTVLFILIVIFLNGVCPLLYTYLQKYKNNIYGPWDEAVIAAKK